MAKKRIAALALFMLILSGCAKPSEPPAAKEQPVQPTPQEQPQPQETSGDSKIEKAPTLPPPKPDEVQEVVTRVFQNAVAADVRNDQNYLVGDFNGDGSVDIAIVVKPATESLPDINSEVANWILEDPNKIILPDPNKVVQQFPPKPEPVRVEQSDVLLAVVHGYGPEGWRNSMARQTYLLKNAVGSSMTTRPIKDLLVASKGKEQQPTLTQLMIGFGNVIHEVRGKESGFIYYTGAKYAWYPK
jgi:hypothetical protein